MGDGVAHPGVCHPLDAGAHVSYFTGLQFFGRNHARNAVADFRHLVALAGIHELDEISFFYRSVENTGVDDHALVTVVIGVEDEAFQAAVRISLWRRNYLNQLLQHFIDAHTGLCRNQRRILRVDSDDIFDFFLGFIRAGAVQIHFVQYRQNLQVLVQSQIDIPQSLRFHALGGIHHQHGAVAGSQRAGHFVVEVHVSRCVDQVQDVLFSVLGLVVEAGGLQLDGDSPLPFNIHVVQILFLHIPGLYQTRLLNQPVRQSGLAVIDMSNNTEISYILQIIHFSSDYFLHFFILYYTQFAPKMIQENISVNRKKSLKLRHS